MASLSDTHEALQQGRGSVAEREPGQGRTSSKENEGRSTSSQQAQHDQRQRRGLSGPRASGTGTGTGRPALRPRWFHARGKGWAAFEKKDDEELERVWKALGGQEWAEGRRVGRERKEEEKDGKEASEQAEGEGEGEGNGGDEDEQEEEEEPAQLSTSSSMEAVKNALGEWLPSSITSRKEGGADGSEEMGEKEKSEKDGKGKGKGKEGEEEKEKKKKMESRVVHQALDPDEPPENRRAKVPVLEDRLFEVDLEQMEVSLSYCRRALAAAADPSAVRRQIASYTPSFGKASSFESYGPPGSTVAVQTARTRPSRTTRDSRAIWMRRMNVSSLGERSIRRAWRNSFGENRGRRSRSGRKRRGRTRMRKWEKCCPAWTRLVGSSLRMV